MQLFIFEVGDYSKLDMQSTSVEFDRMLKE